jgi:hypothetical protein
MASKTFDLTLSGLSLAFYLKDRKSLKKDLPIVPGRVLRKVYKTLIFKAISGQYQNLDLSDVNVWNSLVYDEVSKEYSSQALQRL